MPRPSDQWGTRLADARVPSWWPLGLAAITFARLVSAVRVWRAWNEASIAATEAAELLAQRMAEGDERDERVAQLTEQMAEMTRRMENYGRASVRLAAASLIVASAALMVAVVVAISD